MSRSTPSFLLLEPYYGGSHRVFLEGLRGHVDFHFTILSLPARKWKMRMQLAAPWFAREVEEMIESGRRFDAIFCSSFLDVSVLRALLCKAGYRLPIAVYFHENQFDYPVRVASADCFQFMALNFNTALCADLVGFNSNYNRDTFLRGINFYLRKAADMNAGSLEQELARKSKVLYPGLDFSHIDAASFGEHGEQAHNAPVVVWNHRWEHDKNPDLCFNTLIELREEGVEFRLLVLGRSFSHKPKIFDRVEKKLGRNIVHFGYAQNRRQYARLLKLGDIVVSTARHEFFGMAVLEGVRAGCRPLVPDALAYRELFPTRFRYEPGKFKEALRGVLRENRRLAPADAALLTNRFAWPVVGADYQKWLLDLLETAM